MNKSISKIFLVVLAGTLLLAIMACENKLTNAKNENSSNQYDYVGKNHNRDLDIFLNNMKKMSKADSKANFATPDGVYNFYCEQAKEIHGCSNSLSNAQLLNKKILDTYRNSKSVDILEILIQGTDLTAVQAGFIRQMAADVASSSSKNEVVEKIENLEETITASNLSEQDKAEILIGTATCKNSYAYWSTHQREWIDFLAAQMGTNPDDIDPAFQDILLTSIWKADVGGAIGGAIGGGIGAGLPGVIVGGLGGGAGNSACEYTLQLLDRWF